MPGAWTKPEFEVIDVGMECTAYAGARPPEEERRANAPAAPAPPEGRP